MAKSLSDVPVVGNVVSVLSWTTYKVEKGTYSATIDVPEVELGDSEQLTTLNQKYKEEAQARYEQFMSDMDEMKAAGGGHLGVDSGYEVLTDTEQLLSISR